MVGFSLSVSILLLGITASAHAAPQPPTVLDKIEIKGFPFRYQASDPNSAMKTETALKDTPQAVSVVTEQQIADQALHGMADVVRYVPGVGMAQGEGHRDETVMRGNVGIGDFFTDGVRDDLQYYRDLYNISQVEVLKGPNAMIFGRGGSGGVINRVAKQADGNQVRDLSLQAGSHDFYRIQADLGDVVSGNLAWRVNATAEDAGSFRDGVSRSLRGIAPGLAFGIGDDTRIVLGAEVFRDERTVDRGVPSFQGKPLATGRSRFFGSSADSGADNTLRRLDVLVEHDMDGAVLRNRTRYADFDKFFQNVLPGAVNAAGTTVALSAYNLSADRRNLFNQTDYIFDIERGKIIHRILVGAELGRQDVKYFRETGYFGAPGSTQTSETVSIADPVPTLPIGFRQSMNDPDFGGTADTAAVYVQDQIHIGERWQLVAGLRAERFDMDFLNRRTGVRIKTRDNLLSPRAGLIYQATPDLNLYAGYAESFVPRAGDQLASLTVSNASLAPESFTNREIGLKWQFSEGLFTSLALYRLERGNVAVADPLNPAQALLVDAQRSQGLEWEIGGNLSRTLQVLAGYAYQDAEITRDLSASQPAGTVLPLVPTHSAYLWGRWDATPRWGFGLGLNGRSAVFASTSNAVRLPGFVRIDAAVYYTASERVQWQLNVENLTDKAYFSSAHNDNTISIGTPRELKLAVHLDY